MDEARENAFHTRFKLRRLGRDIELKSANQVAQNIIGFSHEHGDPISNLKLQKLLYYAQAWYLALYDVPLFDDPIEAWVHGPVVPSVYGKYKGWSWRPIDIEPEEEEFDSQTRNHLDEVMDVYGGLSAYDLEKLTHQEDPWRNARGDLPPDAPSNNVISHQDMRDYYKVRVDGKDQVG